MLLRAIVLFPILGVLAAILAARSILLGPMVSKARARTITHRNKTYPAEFPLFSKTGVATGGEIARQSLPHVEISAGRGRQFPPPPL
jgi:hypothetical protein